MALHNSWFKVNHNRIFTEMAKRAWNRKKLALEAQIHAGVMSQLCAGGEITIDMIGKIAKAFDVGPEELVIIGGDSEGADK